MISKLPFPILSPLGGMLQQPDIGPGILILLLWALLLPLTVIVTTTTGYIAGRFSKVSRTTVKGAGIGMAIGISSCLIYMLLLLLISKFHGNDRLIAFILVIGLLITVLGVFTTSLVVRKIFTRDTGA